MNLPRLSQSRPSLSLRRRSAFTSATFVSALFIAACTSPTSVQPENASWEPEPVDPTIAEPATVEPTAISAQDSSSVDEILRADAELLELKEQRRAFLVEQHLANAKTFRDRLRLEDSRSELLAALTIDADNLEVKRALAEVNALLGNDYGSEAATVSDMLSKEMQLRTQQMRAEASDLLREGKLLLAKGDYDGAIAQLTIAAQTVRFAPYSIDWAGTDSEIDSLLERSKGERSAAEEASLRASQREAFEALRAQEDNDSERRQAVVDNMVTQAIEAFSKAKYEDAIYFADQALRKDPRNEHAAELREAAFKAGLDKTRSDYVQNKREQFKRWKEELESYKIPWTPTITLPDADKWAATTALRAKRRGLDLENMRSEADRALRANLQGTLIKLPEVSDEESLRSVIDLIRIMTGLPLVVDPAAENAVNDEGIVFNFSFENDLTVEQALNLIMDFAGEEVTWTVRHDAVLITTKIKARGKPVPVHHDVQDLVFGLTQFMGPRIDRIRLLDELEDDDGGGPFGGITDRVKLINPDELATLIQDNVAPGSWDEDGVTIEPYEGHIIIVHTPEIQEKVRNFLEDLRNFSSSLVTIETKFMTVGDNWIQEIGVDFRGLDDNPLSDVTNGLEDNASRGLDNGGTGSSGSNAAGAPSSGFFYNDGQDGDFRGRTENFFGTALGSTLSTIGGATFQYTLLNDLELSMILRAVEKSSTFELINDQVLSVHNTQRAYVTVLNQRAYIQDFDVEVATFQAVADPQINVLNEGVVLDVRPTIHHDRRYLTLEVQPTVAKVVNIRTYSSTLGGNTSPVEFELPELEVQSVFTTAQIPDGGSILLGGLTNIRNVERRAEVPWLAKIPLVGFFFKTEGYNDENKSLMILIKANITDVREEVRKIEAAY